MPTKVIRDAVSEVILAAIYHGDCTYTRNAERYLLNCLDKLFRIPDQSRRRMFITDFVDRNGYINRSDIMDAFQVSQAIATSDLKNWMCVFPLGLVYNKSSKRYEKPQG
jgi:hypothetical protein